MPGLPSVIPATMNAATAGPRSPGKCVDREPGATRTAVSASGIQYAHDKPYAKTKNATSGRLQTNDIPTSRGVEKRERSDRGKEGQRHPDGKLTWRCHQAAANRDR